MAYLGLVPCEDSSGPRRRQGAITKAGNAPARRVLVKATHLYRYPARASPVIARRQAELPKAVTDIAWVAQTRLCARFRRFWPRGACRTTKVLTQRSCPPNHQRHPAGPGTRRSRGHRGTLGNVIGSHASGDRRA